MNIQSRYSLLAISIFSSMLGTVAYAEESTSGQAAVLDTIEVKAIDEQPKEVQKVVKNKQELDKEMVRDHKDLVRYTTDVGIADSGRFQRGFAIRGVEGNRVGISIDGVSIPNFEDNSLYSRYGNFNSSRLTIDSELVKAVDISRGADSFNSGSGALGGNVNYQTLDAKDLVREDRNFGGLYRTSYASKNNEWINTLGFGFLGHKFETALLYSYRRGHETKSGNKGQDIYRFERGVPDPVDSKAHSFLAKFAYQFNDAHRLGLNINGQKIDRYIDEKSYGYTGLSLWRESDDESRRITTNLNYTYTPNSDIIAKLKADLDYQYTDLAAVNYKGYYRYVNGVLTKIPTIDELDDRRTKTKYKSLSSQLELQPFQFGGEHTVSFRIQGSQRDFKNINEDIINYNSSKDTYVYTIQLPTKTTQYGFSLRDQIIWNHLFSTDLGVRYDYEKVKPLAANAEYYFSNQLGNVNSSVFKNWNGYLTFKVQPTTAWNFGYSIGTAHRVPSASELYFFYNNVAGSWLPNPDLKTERSTTHTLFTQFDNHIGHLDAQIYQSFYRNFLYEAEIQVDYSLKNKYNLSSYSAQQMRNADKGRIRGLEFNGRLNLDSISPAPQGLTLMGSLGYSKGKLSTGDSLLPIQPIKAIIGLDYDHPDGIWGINSRLSYLGGKKAKDAQRNIVESTATYNQGNITSITYTYKRETFPYLNDSAYVFDIFAYYKPISNLTLRAGIYNITNKKYATWDSFRGINTLSSTTNAVNRYNNNEGIQRFYAPGRNYALALEYKF